MRINLIAFVIVIITAHYVKCACKKRTMSLKKTMSLREQFAAFLINYGLSYPNPVEFEYRFQVFSNNTDFINGINSDPTLTFKAGINQFAALTREEFIDSYTGILPMNDTCDEVTNTGRKKRQVPGIQILYVANASVPVPSSLDWRTYGYVTPVKSQGQCGNCWSFSATGALEGQHFKATGQLISFSEENLSDCVYGSTSGCVGGRYYDAWAWINQNGIMTEEAYPYTATNGTTGSCKYNASANAERYLVGYTKIVPNPITGEQILQQALAQTGPLSISVDASYWQLYSSGVFYVPPTTYPCLVVNHAVLLVGYGTDPVYGPYWLIKNSWGENWGEQGYIRIAKNKGNFCRVATYGYFPNIRVPKAMTG